MPVRRVTRLLIILLALAMVWLYACRDSGTYLFSMEDEVRIGREAAAEFEKQNRVSTDPALTGQVARIGAAIATAAKPPNYPYEFKVIDTAEVNAVAFPGGRIYMFRGLMEKLDHDEDMIAWVLGHEVTHVAAHHAAKRLEREIGTQVLAELLLGKSTSAKIARAVAELMFRDYGRDQELQADERGLIYAHRAGYDATAAIAVIKVFQSLGGKDPSKLELLFMTHPGDTTRLNAIRAACKRFGYRGKYYP